MCVTKGGDGRKISDNTIICGTGEENGLGSGKTAECILHQLRCDGTGKGSAGNRRGINIVGRNIQQRHGIVYALMAATLQNQITAHAHCFGKQGIDALSRAAGKE